MNKVLLFCVNLLPESLLIPFVKYYVDRKIRRHAKLHVEGLEHLDGEMKRPFLFVCNHLSNSDGLILNKVLEHEDITFLAGKKLEANSLTNLGFKIVKSIPISPSSADKEAIKKVVSTVKAGNSILIFPEGTRSRTAQMIEGKKGILLIAKLTQAPIVPVGLWGTEQFIPIEKDMGKETFFDADIHIRIGQPFILLPKGESLDKENWEEESLRQIMMNIAELLPSTYRGYYGQEA